MLYQCLFGCQKKSSRRSPQVERLQRLRSPFVVTAATEAAYYASSSFVARSCIKMFAALLLASQVWRHFRFVMPNRMFESALVDTQVLRGGSAHPLAAAESSTWLMRAGRTGLKLDIQVGRAVFK